MSQAVVNRNPVTGITVEYPEAYRTILDVVEVIQEQCADIKAELELVFPFTEVTVSVEITTKSYGYRVVVDNAYRRFSGLIPVVPGQTVRDVCTTVLKLM